MRIAVACTTDFRRITGHAGRARCWLVFEASLAAPPERVELAPDQVFHHVESTTGHPLQAINAIITLSAGEGFINKMSKRGVAILLTGERDPAKAVADHLANRLTPPKPRPIGALLCKAVDLFSKHT